MKENISNYMDLEVWKIARKLTNESYAITKKFPKDESFGLTLQLRRCAVSITSNIAEGAGRNSYKDTLHFLYISRGSTYELETQFLIAFDQHYISKAECDNIQEIIIECKKLLNGFINYYKKQITK